MRRTMIGAAAGLLVLAGCTGTTEPAQPPTQEDALTTATVAPVATSDEVEVTTDAPVTGDETEETAEPEAAGPPEMPDEAKEQTEAGAAAFALHYLEMVNYTGQHPEPGVLDPLAADSCKTCENYEANLASLLDSNAANDGDAASIGEAQAISQGDSYVVFVDLEQNAYQVKGQDGEILRTYDRISGVQFKFTLAGDPFQVQEIQVSTS